MILNVFNSPTTLVLPAKKGWRLNQLQCAMWNVVRCFIWTSPDADAGATYPDYPGARHNSVHFFDISTSKSGPKLRCFVHFGFEMCFAPQRRAITHLPSGLHTRPFSQPTFRPSGATIHWKNTVFRDFPTFSHTWIFFLLRLSLLWSSFFFSSLRWLFPSLLFICPYCRKFDF